MAILSIELDDPDAMNQVPSLVDRLYSGGDSALLVRGASREIEIGEDGRLSMGLPWIDALGTFAPDRATELGGTAFFSDMPPHIDPHPEDRLKVLLMEQGKALARFVPRISIDLLDATNELPGSDYAPLEQCGITADEIQLDEGIFVCFLGSVTLHEFVSIGQRTSYINSYQPVT